MTSASELLNMDEEKKAKNGIMKIRKKLIGTKNYDSEIIFE